jgi:hypothetical protein
MKFANIWKIMMIDDCQFTFDELKDEVSGHIPDNKTIRARLMQKYGNNIVISLKTAYSSTVSFKNKEHDVLSAKWY